MPEQVPFLRTTCEDCGGPATAARNLFGTGYRHGPDNTGTWRHDNDDDWADRPHNVVPRPEDAERVRDHIYREDYALGRHIGLVDSAGCLTHLRELNPTAWEAQSEAWKRGYENGWEDTRDGDP